MRSLASPACSPGAVFPVAVGAHTAGMLATRYGLNPYLCVLAGMAAAVVVSFIIGHPACACAMCILAGHHRLLLRAAVGAHRVALEDP